MRLRLRRRRRVLRGHPDARRQRGDGGLAAAGPVRAAAAGIAGRGAGYGVGLRRGRVFADLWDIEKLFRCPRCGPARAGRLDAMNRDAGRRAAGRLRLRGGRMIREQADVAILGAGFAGSLLAMVLRRLGRSVVLVEQGATRASPSANPRRRWPTWCWNRWPATYDLPRLAPLAEYGRGSAPTRTWPAASSAASPSSARAGQAVRRRGPTTPTNCWSPPARRDDAADTHWFREHFDHFLARRRRRRSGRPTTTARRLPGA